MPSPSNIEQMTERIAELEAELTTLRSVFESVVTRINSGAEHDFPWDDSAKMESVVDSYVKQFEAGIAAQAELSTLRTSQRAGWNAAYRAGQEEMRGRALETMHALDNPIKEWHVRGFDSVDLPADWTPEGK